MKKVLSFVLSVAMVICLMPAMAFAADASATGISQFSDKDSINNKEAVAVLVGLGVIDGMGDGTFQPQGDLTRAQASKLVATVVKSGDKSDIPAPAADPFTDVAKDYWGAGAIQFGVDNGYINGMGDGTFVPDGNVTTAQLATMLEKVLGYTVADVNYNWPENAMGIAQGGYNGVDCDLLKGITKGADQALNREEAAQMIFNALDADCVVKASTTGGNTVDGTTGYNAVKNDSKLDYQGRPNDVWQQLVEKYFPKAAIDETSTDIFGRDTIAWKNGRTQISDAVVESPAYTYTKAMTEDELKADLDGYQFNGVVWYNGHIQQMEMPETVADFAAITGNGKLIEVYTNEKDTEITKIICIDYAPATVTKVNAKAKTVELSKAKPVTADDDAYATLSALKVDDVVLVAVNPSTDFVIDAYLPTEVTGAITKITTPKEGAGVVTVGGKDYEQAVTAMEEDFVVNPRDNGTAYLDKYGYLECYANEKAAEAEVADWILVKDVYSKTSTSTTNKYVDEGNVTTTTYSVLAVTEDGKVEDLTLNTNTDEKNGATEASMATFEWADEMLSGDNVETGIAADGSEVAAVFFEEGVLVTYAETADGYTIAEEDESTKSEALATTELVKAGATAIDSTYVSTDVKVVTVTGEKASDVKATTAATLPELPQGTQYIVKDNGKNILVTTVFVEDEAPAPAVPLDVIKVTGKTADVTYTDKDGKQQAGSTVAFYNDDKATAQEMTVSNADVAEGWYTYEEIATGVNELTPYESGDDDVMISSGVINEIYNGSVTIDGEIYNISGANAVRDLREDGDATVETLEPGMVVEFAYTTDEKTEVSTITQLYVIAVVDEEA